MKDIIRACTTHRQLVVGRILNLAYRQVYRQFIQPTDKDVVCNLFNALHVAKLNYKHIFVHHCVTLYTIMLLFDRIYQVKNYAPHICLHYRTYLCRSSCVVAISCHF
jgi:hypothetical protein